MKDESWHVEPLEVLCKVCFREGLRTHRYPEFPGRGNTKGSTRQRTDEARASLVNSPHRRNRSPRILRHRLPRARYWLLLAFWVECLIALFQETHGFGSWSRRSSFDRRNLALVLVQFHVRIVFAGMIGSPTAFCTKPFLGRRVPGEVRVLGHFFAQKFPPFRDGGLDETC